MVLAARLRVVALAVFMALVGSSCFYAQAVVAEANGGPSPWFCNPTIPNSVNGPGMGSVNWYAGVTREPLSDADCKTLAFQLDLAKTYAGHFPTLADAEAAGFRATFNRIPGMGTHHGLDAITPELLADPDFDPANPIIPGIIDDVFNPAQPEFMQYDGHDPDSPLVGMSYYVRTDTGLPPEGFVGDNDWWHHHPTLCMDPVTAVASLGVNTTDAVCAGRGGINVHLQDYYMLHVWIVTDMEYHLDIHAPTMPCIGATSTIFDMDDPCHDSLPPFGASPDGSPVGLFCPIGTIEDQFTT